MGTVLIVDDEPDTREILAAILERDGRKIATADDGQDAIERLKDIPDPCLIVLDLTMPRMNGWEFLRRQSNDLSIAGIPTVVLSGERLPSGAKHQLPKPVDTDRLQALVDQYC